MPLILTSRLGDLPVLSLCLPSSPPFILQLKKALPYGQGLGTKSFGSSWPCFVVTEQISPCFGYFWHLGRSAVGEGAGAPTEAGISPGSLALHCPLETWGCAQTTRPHAASLLSILAEHPRSYQVPRRPTSPGCLSPVLSAVPSHWPLAPLIPPSQFSPSCPRRSIQGCASAPSQISDLACTVPWQCIYFSSCFPVFFAIGLFCWVMVIMGLI